MLVLLQLLQQTLEQYWDGTSDASRVGRLCLRLQADVPRSFREYADPALAAADFVRYHRGLVALYQRALPPGEGNAATVEVGKLLRSHETLFGDLIPPSDPLPDFHLADLEAGTRRAWAHIVARLGEKEVPACYLAEVGYALDALFAAGKTPLATYHHRQYLPDFMRMLRQIADDPRPKDWPKRMVEALVNHNFNYMGFFNRWKEAREAELTDESRAPALVTAWYDSLRHQAPVPGLAFIPERASLFEHMARFVSSKAFTITESVAQQACTPETGIKTTMNGKMQALDFRYRFKREHYDYPSMQEAAHAYSKAHLSKTGRNISPHTLQRFDTLELEDAAHLLIRDLSDMIEQIKQDFRL